MIDNLKLLVKPTHKCPLNCKYCYDKQFNVEEDMSLKTVEKICQFATQSAQHVTWIWHGGKPLLMGVDWLSKANDIILSKTKNEVKINMQTNGTLIDEQAISMFKKYNIRPGLSFDGINNNLTRKNTGKLSTVFNLLEKYDVGYGCIMVITPDNVKNLIDEYKYSKRMNIMMQMNPIFKAQDNNQTTNLDADLMIEGICEFFDYWIKDQDSPFNSLLITRYLNQLLNTGEGFCSEDDCVGRWFAIHPDGTIQPCGRNWGNDMSFGNIHEINSIEDIYNHPNYIRFRKETRQLLSECKANCPFYYACKGGCFGNIYNAHGNFLKPEENHCKATRKILTHIYNRIKELDIKKDFENYNPLFVKYLQRFGFRNINQLKQIIS